MEEGRRRGRRYKEGDFWGFQGEIRLCICGKMKEDKLEEGENSRMIIYVNNSEDKEWRGSCSRYYWSVGSGARKPMGFLGPAHDESWSARWMRAGRHGGTSFC